MVIVLVIVGVLFFTTLLLFIWSLCRIASDADDQTEEMHNKESEK